MSERNWSPQQLAIFAWFAAVGAAKNLVVRARAGTGKSTTAVEAINRAQWAGRILMAAFAKRNATDLQAKVSNPKADVKTLHALGYGYIRRVWANIQLDNNRGRKLAVQVCGVDAPDTVIGQVAKLAAMAKNMLPFATREEELTEIQEDFELGLDDEWLEQGFDDQYVRVKAIEAKEQARHNDGSIDFDDMLFVPVANGFITASYDLVVIDECFPSDTPILLSDNTTKPIGEIVEKRLPVSVLSYNPKTGKQEIRKVIDYKKVPLRKKTVCVHVQQLGFDRKGRPWKLETCRSHYGSRRLVCTEDHKFFVNGVWVEAKNLKAGDNVQLESTAPRDIAYNHKYKHGIEGKARLAASLEVRRDGLPRGTNARGPVKRGGNGTGLTVPQKLLLEALGEGWFPEYTVVLKRAGSKKAGHPYFVDLANPSTKQAIELDGSTHRSAFRQELDARKDFLLRKAGWRVSRFANLEVVRDTDKIARQFSSGCSIDSGCPVGAVVLSVREHPIKDYFVYDLTVEGTHCYYAHGILVHNCQDMGYTQLVMAQRACKKDGRIVVIGDDRQAMYGFRGADSGSIDRLKSELSAEELPLTITYRCPKQVVALAQALVPDYQAAPTAPEGEILSVEKEKLIDMLFPGDLVLSRKNAPLASLCLRALRSGKKACVSGRDIGAGLVSLIKRLGKAKNMPHLMEKLGKWEDREVAKWQAAKKENKVVEVQDRAETIRELADGLTSVKELENRINSLFTDNGDNTPKITFSTVHRAKGGEAQRVFVLRSTLYPYKGAEGKIEEQNIHYVALTRSMQTLIFVEGKF